MITKEFTKWVEGIKTLIEKRVGNEVDVWLELSHRHFDVILIGITLSNGMMFWASFDQAEFNWNNYNRRRSLAKVRREDMVITMEDYAKETLRIARKLK